LKEGNIDYYGPKAFSYMFKREEVHDQRLRGKSQKNGTEKYFSTKGRSSSLGGTGEKLYVGAAQVHRDRGSRGETMRKRGSGLLLRAKEAAFRSRNCTREKGKDRSLGMRSVGGRGDLSWKKRPSMTIL